MKIKKEILPILTADIIGILSIIQVVFTEYVFINNQIIGLYLLLITSILFFINRTIYKYFFLTILMIGLFGLIGFSNHIITFGFSFFQIRLIPLLILIIFYLVNKEWVKSFFSISEDEKSKQAKEITNRFINKFNNLTNEEIDMKLQEPLIDEALEALKIIKQNRKNDR